MTALAPEPVVTPRPIRGRQARTASRKPSNAAPASSHRRWTSNSVPAGSCSTVNSACTRAAPRCRSIATRVADATCGTPPSNRTPSTWTGEGTIFSAPGGLPNRPSGSPGQAAQWALKLPATVLPGSATASSGSRRSGRKLDGWSSSGCGRWRSGPDTPPGLRSLSRTVMRVGVTESHSRAEGYGAVRAEGTALRSPRAGANPGPAPAARAAPPGRGRGRTGCGTSIRP